MGPGEIVEGREALDEGAELFDDARDLGLLEHDLGDERAVGVALAGLGDLAPGEVPGVGAEPSAEVPGDGGVTRSAGVP